MIVHVLVIHGHNAGVTFVGVTEEDAKQDALDWYNKDRIDTEQEPMQSYDELVAAESDGWTFDIVDCVIRGDVTEAKWYK